MLAADYIRVGDETGIQEGFQERVGQVLSFVSSNKQTGWELKLQILGAPLIAGRALLILPLLAMTTMQLLPAN